MLDLLDREEIARIFVIVTAELRMRSNLCLVFDILSIDCFAIHREMKIDLQLILNYQMSRSIGLC